MMEGQFCETLISRKKPAGYGPLCVVGIFVSCAGWIGGIFWAPIWIAAVLVTVLTFLFWRNGAVEYEYSWVGDELRIDCIRTRSRRKRAETLDADGIQLVAPISSPLVGTKARSGETSVDYTSKKKNREVYVLIYEKSGKEKRVLWEPGEKMLHTMKNTMPRKINL